MDFFQNQDKARTKTQVLVFYFGLAISSMIILIYIVIACVLNANSSGKQAIEANWFHPEVLLFVTIGVTSVVGLASLFKVSEIRRGGGEQVASMLGGRRISSATTDQHERVVMNVVEEMAIASGTVVPRVYILEEKGIKQVWLAEKLGKSFNTICKSCSFSGLKKHSASPPIRQVV